jgi:hypothetical protein
VIPACAVLDGDRLRVGAVVVAVVATATSWWCERRLSRVRVVTALAVAGGAALVAVQLALELPGTTDGLVTSLFAAGVGFELVTLGASPARRRRGVALAWMVPLLAVSVAGALAWESMGDVGSLVLGALGAAAFIGWAAWGAPAWPSRVAAVVASSVCSRVWVAAVRGAAVVAIGATAVAISVRDPATAAVWAWVGAGIAEVAISMVAAGVRQWRFAPWPRRRGYVVVAASAVVVLVAADAAARGAAWSVVAVAVAMLAVVLTARVPARRLHPTATDDHVQVR